MDLFLKEWVGMMELISPIYILEVSKETNNQQLMILQSFNKKSKHFIHQCLEQQRDVFD